MDLSGYNNSKIWEYARLAPRNPELQLIFENIPSDLPFFYRRFSLVSPGFVFDDSFLDLAIGPGNEATSDTALLHLLSQVLFRTSYLQSSTVSPVILYDSLGRPIDKNNLLDFDPGFKTRERYISSDQVFSQARKQGISFSPHSTIVLNLSERVMAEASARAFLS